MDYFPLFARLTDAPCLIAGGGRVAVRKARQLLKAGACVTVCAPDICDEMQQLADSSRVVILKRSFAAVLVADFLFVVAATNDPHVNGKVAAAARQHRVLCNVVDNRQQSSAIVPAVVDRSPLIIAISSSGEAPVLATRIRQQIETLLPPGLGNVALFMGKWRDVVRKRFSNLDQRRRFWQQVLDSRVTDRLLNNDAGAARTLFEKILSAEPTAELRTGLGMIVGAGPGDPELLTLKAVRALNTADVVLYDRLVASEILDYARKDADFIYVGKQAGNSSTPQGDINALLVELVAAGKRVCRLKGGDPFVFGRGGEEVAALATAGLPWQVIPGITAASGCAAAAGIPLTHRQVARSLTYITAHSQDGTEPDWASLAGEEQTAVFYMPVSKLQRICTALIAAGRSPACPAALIENGSTAVQRTVRGVLADLPQRALDAAIKSPALLIVGAVTATEWPDAA